MDRFLNGMNLRMLPTKESTAFPFKKHVLSFWMATPKTPSTQTILMRKIGLFW